MQISRRPLTCAVGIVLASGLACLSGADAAPVVQLGTLDGGNGFRFDGEAAFDQNGSAVSGAGDVNGDGFADVLFSSPSSDANGSNAGRNYVIFGRDSGFPAVFDPATLDGTAGFRLDGSADDYAGLAVSGAGDINDDGIADIAIGAPYGGTDAGKTYVVFGSDAGFPASVDLATLDGSDGFRADGAEADDLSGRAVAGAGDINGDGVDDLVIGAPFEYSAPLFSGSSYVVFGSGDPFAATLDLGALDGNNGFHVQGLAAYDYSGYSVAGVGDINGDDFDDLVIGAFGANAPYYSNAGNSYVIFGSDAGFPASFDLDALDGGNGFRLYGALNLDFSGRAVSSAGDINGDGFDDLLIGASFADPQGASSGSAYVVFGRPTGFPADLALNSVDGTTGFRMDGASANEYSGTSVAAAGDVNGDGFDDILIGAPYADPDGGSNRGGSYLVFGHPGAFPPTLPLGALNGGDGVRFDGATDSERSGYSLSGAGDINGDGIDDIAIGANGHNVDIYNQGEGATYVVFGNAAPQRDGQGAEIAAILEDAADPAGTRVDTTTLAYYLDVDPLAGIGITLDAPASVTGSWQFFTDAAGVWADVPTTGLSVTSGLVLDIAARLRFVAAADFNGPAPPLSVRLWDGADATYPSGVVSDIHGSIGSLGGFANDANLLLIGAFVLPVNDAPSFSAPPIDPIPIDAGPQTLPNWATFDPGPDNESAQTATWLVSDIGHPELFAELPNVDPDGSLHYTPAAGTVGTSQFTLRVMDSGGTDNGGIDTSAPQVFTIEVLVGADRVFCDGFDGLNRAG